jgi:thiol:disulfide interchange protein DsbA
MAKPWREYTVSTDSSRLSCCNLLFALLIEFTPMINRRFLIFFLALWTQVSFAAPNSPKEGAEYMTLPVPQPVQASGKKIEVLEFFMYHCPACNELEPDLSDWVKRQGDKISFRRVHIPHTGANDPEAHLFLTLEAMKIAESLHGKVMQTWHVDRKQLKSDADNLDWAVKAGLDKAKFLESYNSFSVMTKLRNLSQNISGYQVEGTPTLVVNGRFLTTPSMVYEANRDIPRAARYKAFFQVVDALLTK